MAYAQNRSRSVPTYIVIYEFITYARTYTHTHTHAHTIFSLLLLDYEIGASSDAKGLVPASISIGCLLECNPTP